MANNISKENHDFKWGKEENLAHIDDYRNEKRK